MICSIQYGALCRRARSPCRIHRANVAGESPGTRSAGSRVGAVSRMSVEKGQHGPMDAPRFTQTNSAFAMSAPWKSMFGRAGNRLEPPDRCERFPTLELHRDRYRRPDPRRRTTPAARSRHRPHLYAQGVSGVVAARRMTWSDGLLMEERFSGLLLALVKRTLPDFRPIFEAYANDLKREAERIALSSRK